MSHRYTLPKMLVGKCTACGLLTSYLENRPVLCKMHWDLDYQI
jgi:hypothetical protein